MTSQIRDLSGQRFGKLVVVEYTGKRTEPGHNAIWLCKCDCGKTIEVRGSNLTTTRRPQKSCGCYVKEKARLVNTTHGGTHERLYGVWMGMRRRCYDPKIKDYGRYGGRGIKVCEEWKDYSNFRKWAFDSNYDQYADFQKCTLDRIDPDGNYEPDNCRWVDITEQENNRRNSTKIEYQGKTQTVSMWERELGMKHGLLRDRLKRGWDVERAITQPVEIHKKRF